ncbi:MAG TPA: DUF2834 domain-containing protein [Sandaracinaceae bacterium LLY-WYZ-13_1]|nr:DUF2834 domain-containing protein [Sandaracinaceae bacterium LLY-WYZ-13_1]
MSASTKPPSRRAARVSAALGVAGLVVSWAFFGAWGLAHGPELGRFWTLALATGDSAGLVWDLVFSAGIVTALTLARRRAWGPGRVAAVLLTTWILGVCGGLGLYAVFSATVDEP